MDGPKVAILIEWGGSCARGVLRGIRNNPVSDGWDMRLGGYEMTFDDGYRPDGVITWLGSMPDERREELLDMGIPVANVLSLDGFSHIPSVGEEQGEVGRLAADHFLNRGFSSFAYVGTSWPRRSQAERGTCFRELVLAHGYDCQVYEPDSTSGLPALGEWLMELPKPAALLAHFDILGREVVELCRTYGIRVPDDVAVLGVDNDEVFCELSRPRLSSVAFPWERMGAAACDMLAVLMEGETPEPLHVRIPPTHIVTRESTDVVAVDDPRLAEALCFILEHSASDIGVTVIAEHVGMSRRALERRFMQQMRCSPLEQVRRIRLRHVQSLLRTTDLTIKEIATRTGFNSAERLCVVFRQAFGQTPGNFRTAGVWSG